MQGHLLILVRAIIRWEAGGWVEQGFDFFFIYFYLLTVSCMVLSISYIPTILWPLAMQSAFVPSPSQQGMLVAEKMCTQVACMQVRIFKILDPLL